jgi:hypothetical protein
MSTLATWLPNRGLFATISTTKKGRNGKATLSIHGCNSVLWLYVSLEALESDMCPKKGSEIILCKFNADTYFVGTVLLEAYSLLPGPEVV